MFVLCVFKVRDDASITSQQRWLLDVDSHSTWLSSPKNSKPCFRAVINVNYLIPRITWIAKNLKQSAKVWHYDNIESNVSSVVMFLRINATKCLQTKNRQK